MNSHLFPFSRSSVSRFYIGFNLAQLWLLKLIWLKFGFAVFSSRFNFNLVVEKWIAVAVTETDLLLKLQRGVARKVTVTFRTSPA